MFTSMFVVVMLFVVPTVVLFSLNSARPIRRIALELTMNFAGVFLATMVGLLLVYDIEMGFIGKSLALDPDGIWPLEGTPEQEAYIRRRINDAWKVMSVPFSLMLAATHSLLVGVVLLFQRNRHKNSVRQKLQNRTEQFY